MLGDRIRHCESHLPAMVVGMIEDLRVAYLAPPPFCPHHNLVQLVSANDWPKHPVRFMAERGLNLGHLIPSPAL